MYRQPRMLRELERTLARMRPASDILKRLSPSSLDYLKHAESLSSKLMLPPKYLSASDDILRTMNAYDLNSSFPKLSRYSNILRGYDSIQKQMAPLLAASKAVESSVSLLNVVSGSLVGSEAVLRLNRDPFENISLLTRAHESFQKFAASQIKFSPDATDIFKSNTAVAITASARLLPDMSYASELSLLLDPAIAQTVAVLPPINIFEELNVDFDQADLNDPDLDMDEIVEESSSATVVELGVRIVKLMFDLNTDAERSGNGPLFKPTTRGTFASCLISTTAASQENRFFEVVDSLYFLLYEGSGDAKRLTDRTSELDPLWMVKHLRSGARHDLDHGKNKKYQEKVERIGAVYIELIGRPVPRTREEWLGAQIVLYERIVEMLEHLWFD